MSHEEQDRQDAADVAVVDAAQKAQPPLQPIVPQAITFADIEANDLFGAGCYLLTGNDDAMVFLGDDVRGAMKLDGKIVTFAADAGSTRLPYSAYQRYTSTAYSAEFSVPEGEPQSTGLETSRWPGSVTIRDAFERPVYEGKGMLECGA